MTHQDNTATQPNASCLHAQDAQSWLNTIWDALEGFRDDCIPEGQDPRYDEQWDDICSAMAWIREALGLPDPVAIQDRIRELNDTFRQHPSVRQLIPGVMIVTNRVKLIAQELSEIQLDQLLMTVRLPSDFFTGVTPQGENTFGSIEMYGETWCWKIDYYADKDCDRPSEDPSDRSKCFRVLTVMHSSEQ